MISANGDTVKICGSPATIMTEATGVLKLVYEHMVDTFGEEEAGILFTHIGMLAVCPDDEIEELVDELFKGPKK